MHMYHLWCPQVIPYIPVLKKVEDVTVVGFNLDDVLKLTLTTPVQVWHVNVEPFLGMLHI